MLLKLQNENMEHNFDKINELKKELQEIRDGKLKGMLIRSRARWVEEGEKASRYFCSLENRNFVSKRMSSLINNEGRELFKDTEIRSEVQNFYKSLYSSREQAITDVNLDNLLGIDTPKLTDLEAMSLEGEITLREAGNFLKTMQNNKSPRSTGFTTKFLIFSGKILVCLL